MGYIRVTFSRTVLSVLFHELLEDLWISALFSSPYNEHFTSLNNPIISFCL